MFSGFSSSIVLLIPNLMIVDIAMFKIGAAHAIERMVCLRLVNAQTATGSGQLISDFIVSVMGNMASPYLVFVIWATLSLVISQFITNSTAIIIVLPVAIFFCSAAALSPMPYCIGITLGASVACCTPLAAAQIAMTQVAGYRFSDYLKYGWPLSLLLLLGICIFVPLMYPFTAV